MGFIYIQRVKQPVPFRSKHTVRLLKVFGRSSETKVSNVVLLAWYFQDEFTVGNL